MNKNTFLAYQVTLLIYLGEKSIEIHTQAPKEQYTSKI